MKSYVKLLAYQAIIEVITNSITYKGVGMENVKEGTDS
jgi:hypothetical protein